MSKDSSQPTFSWPSEDKLNRDVDANVLLRFIEGKLEQRAQAGLSKSYVLNLDSQWGSGKTFFLKSLKNKITANGQVAVYVDAWQDDHSDDPFIAIVAAIEDELKRVIKENTAFSGVKNATLPVAKSALKVMGSGLKSGMVHYAKKQIGREALEQFGSLLNSDDDDDDNKAFEDSIVEATNSAVEAAGMALLSNFAASKSARAAFRENLENLTEELEKMGSEKVPVFVLIDELDRCRPSYAVELLEEVKHLFYVENMVFILGTDTEQLAHAVKGVYGPGFDGRRYLSRFIDRTYKFRESKIEDFVKHSLHKEGLSEEVFSTPKEFTVSDILTAAFENADASLRYIEQIVDYLATFAAGWKYEGIKINFILLFRLAVRSHPESMRSDTGEYVALETAFEFTRGNALGPVRTISYSINDMSYKIQSVSANIQNAGSPKDDFELWMMNLVSNEITVTSSLNTERAWSEETGLADKYPGLFQDMLGIHRPLADG